MEYIRLRADHGFDRLERLLLAMKVGDELCLVAVAKETGLSESVCRAVFQGLERVGLMAQQTGDRYVRRSLDMQQL